MCLAITFEREMMKYSLGSKIIAQFIKEITPIIATQVKFP
jgi:hypothetical protein